MAKKKTTTVTEEVEEIPQEEELNYSKDIAGKSMSQIVDPVIEGAKPKEEVKEEIKAEEPKEEKPAEEEKKPEIDPEQLKKDISEETTNKIVEALQGKDSKQTEENLNRYQKYAKDVWEKEGRNPTWDEVLPLIEEAAIQKLESRQEEERQKVNDQQKAADDARQQELQNFNKELEEELGELYSSGKLTRIKDDTNPNDPGVKEREALFQAMATTNNERVEKGLPPIRSISRIHANYYKAPNRQPAGANAAIINNRGGSVDAGEEEINYLRDVKGKKWTDLFRR